MSIKNVTIAGAGTLGSQIAWQSAFKGFKVTVYDAFEKGLENGKKFHQQFAGLFKTERGATEREINQTMARLSYTINLAEGVKDADIVSESVPENSEIKKSFYTELNQVAPEKTIFATNSSTMVPSELVDAVDRPEKFLALHFANGIWDSNVGEVMGHPGTDPVVFDKTVAFARDIGMVPIPIHKEQPGYVLNTLLVPLLSAALNLYVNDISDIESIDKTWMIAMGITMGPFGLMDIIGLETIYNVNLLIGNKKGDKEILNRAARIKEHYIDQGKLGTKSGEGFYKYPNPSYQDPSFLK